MSRKILITYFHLIIVSMSYEILVCSSSDMYTACSNKYTCGAIDADFPFVGGERLDGCGYPGLKLGCENKDTATITIKDVKYQVLELKTTSETLVIARVDFLDGICSPKHGNTSLDNDLFEYGSGTSMDVTLVYDCPEEVRFFLPTEFECSDDDKGYVLLGNPGNNGGGACRSVVNARVSMTDELFINNATFKLSVFENAMSKGFDVKYKTDSEGCEECRKSGGVCGYDAKLGHTTCYCSVSSVGTCSSASLETPQKKAGGTRNLIIGIITAGVLGIVILLISVYYCRRNRKLRNVIIFWRRDVRDEFDVEEFIRNYGSFAPKRYSYGNVKKMTNSFAEKIGIGGYGSVYKGKLPDDRLVAVKMLNKCTGDGEEFVNEVTSIGRTSHVNIVTLLGFCCEGKKRALIYEYMVNGSLDRLIFKREAEASNSEHCLEWHMLYEIALGIARGLEYLHQGCNTTILHLDIKPQNILLDDDLQPKISDFGLAQLWLKKEKTLSMVGARGTIGYMAPEVFSRAYGRVSQKSDVYSFGMLVLEMVGGRKNFDSGVSRTSEIYFPNKVYKDMELGNEPAMMGETAEEKEVSMKMILVSFWCIQTNPTDRPSMSKVMDMLQGSLESLEVPPKPYLFSPTRSPTGSSAISFQDFAAETEQS